jgi:hypothetical protein
MKNVPAFPAVKDSGEFGYTIVEGMTLRDYFAAKTIQGLVHLLGVGSYAQVVQDAYKVADLMLEERENASRV